MSGLEIVLAVGAGVFFLVVWTTLMRASIRNGGG